MDYSFDDVAFYYFVMSVLGMVTLPWTCYLVYSAVSTHLTNRAEKAKDVRSVKVTSVGGNSQRSVSSIFFARSNIVLAIFWLVFIFAFLQLSAYKDQKLYSYNPFEILGLDPGASDAEIKKSFRAASKLYHPDHNHDPDAPEIFMKYRKAFETLSDPAKKENWEKFGNPDGNTGISITIGLPSFLTKKEHSMRLLLVYFLIFIIIPPIIVLTWWRSAKDKVDSGVSVNTFRLFYQFITPRYGPKFLIEILSRASEYEILALRPTVDKDLKALFELVKENMARKKMYSDTAKIIHLNPRQAAFFKTSVLFHAYLLRVPIPASLHEDLRIVLKDAHRLLNTMLQTTLEPRYAVQRQKQVSFQLVTPALATMELMQQVTQAVWVEHSELMQLPHFTPQLCLRGKRKHIETLGQFKRMPLDKKKRLWDNFTDEQWKDINTASELLPEIDLTYEYGVKDEKEESSIREGDMLTITVALERVNFDPLRPEGEQRKKVVDVEDENASDGKSSNQTPALAKPAAAVPPASGEKKKTKAEKAKEKSEKEKENADEKVEKTPADAGAGAAGGNSSSSSDNKDETKSSATDESKGTASSSTASNVDDDEDVDEEELNELIVNAESTKKKSSATEGPVAYAPHFPFEKREKWVVFLKQKSDADFQQFINFERVPALNDKSTVEFRFPAPRVNRKLNPDGVFHFEIHAVCDSYVGLDKMASFTLKVDSGAALKKASSPLDDDDDEEDGVVDANGKEGTADGDKKDEKPPQRTGIFALMDEANQQDGKWYYLGAASFLEFLLTLVILGLLCVVIFNFLVSRGYWQRYIQPTTDAIGTVVRPVYDAALALPLLGPAITNSLALLYAAMDLLNQALTRPPPPPNRRYFRGRRLDGESEDDEQDKESEEAEADRKRAEAAMKDEDGALNAGGEEDQPQQQHSADKHSEEHANEKESANDAESEKEHAKPTQRNRKN